MPIHLRPRVFWRSGLLYRTAPKWRFYRRMWILGRIGVRW